jgi:hypothetical protein
MVAAGNGLTETPHGGELVHLQKLVSWAGQSFKSSHWQLGVLTTVFVPSLDSLG